MPERLTVDLFVEDVAHESFLGPLVERIVLEGGQRCDIRTRSARGGHPRMLGELRAYQELVRRGQPGLTIPDILVLARDTDCAGHTETREGVLEIVDPSVFPSVAVACPNPCIERWYMADGAAVGRVVGADPSPVSHECDCDEQKKALKTTIIAGGNPPTLGGIEFAPDLVAEFSLYQAGRRARELKHFIDDFKQALALATS